MTRQAIIVVDHGSRRDESNRRLLKLVEMFRERHPDTIVEPAHMELAAPSIEDSFDACVAQGAELVIVNPFFLLPGRHWKQDIPHLTSEAAKKHPGIKFLVTAPLELHPLILDIMSDRIENCFAVASGASKECDVCNAEQACQFRESNDALIE